MINANLMMLGAISMGNLMVTMFFLRFWKTTHDRFFLFFATSFLIDGISRIMMGMTNHADEYEPLFYSVRLLTFLIIIIAIIDKNWVRKDSSVRTTSM